VILTPPRPISRRTILRSAATCVIAARAPGIFAAAEESRRSKLILLGTAGGPTPKPNRAAPASAITVNGSTYVIDCGNGVARQLVLAGIKLSSLKAVFVTHHHSDHNADYGNLLWLAWAADLATRVDTYGPSPLTRMTKQFLAMNAFDIRTRMTDEGRPPLAPLISPHDIAGNGFVMEDANVRVTAAIVAHPPVKPSLAYRFDCPDRSIVFSGDTAPSEALISLAQGAHILVHEVMHLPSIEALIASEPNAVRLRQHLIASHTTTEQVGRIATQAGVKTLVLTHFVPGGYPFLSDEIWRDAVRPFFKGEISVGRDLMAL
jgi:ribonuclease BN (tRNA processing enzyme)